MQCGVPVCVALLATCLSTSLLAQESVNIGVVEDLSGFNSARGQQIVQIYKKVIEDINSRGGLDVGRSRYKINLQVRDAESNSSIALSGFMRLISDKSDVVLCTNIACISAAEKEGIPLVSTAYWKQLNQDRKKNIFIINAPAPEDANTQAELGIRVALEGIRAAATLSRDRIVSGIQDLKFETNFGSIGFDANGNNVGRVSFRVGSTSRPDAAGCTAACAKDCPKDCGQTTCTKSGENQCCNLCGMPRPNGLRRVR